MDKLKILRETIQNISEQKKYSKEVYDKHMGNYEDLRLTQPQEVILNGEQ